MVENTRKSLATIDLNGMINLKKKLQALKIVIKQWTKNAKKSSYKAKIFIQSKLSDINKILDQDGSNKEILSDRSLLLKELNDINYIDSLEVAHKSKIRWAIEGDENTKFFHGLFLGIPIDSSLTLSHFFFADNAIFIGKWDSLNIHTIVNVLKCFHMALGLKINFHKSKLMGISTRPEEVKAAATTMGCLIFTTPFVHLGVKVGDNYKQITVVEKINHASMVDSFRRSPRGATEKEQLGFLLSRMDPDRWVWSLEATDRHLWMKLMRWWELEDIDLASYNDWLLWLNSSWLSKRLKEILEDNEVCEPAFRREMFRRARGFTLRTNFVTDG
nr:RNA-directed DNA polymerase, eukaryota [Tanacetum cinerariifolium]